MKIDIANAGILGGAIAELQEVYSRYSDYAPTKLNDMPFHDPMDEQESKLSNKEKMKNLLFLGFGVLVMLALTVYTVVTGANLTVMIIMIGITVVFLAFLISIITKPVQVLKGRVILKQVKRSSESGAYRNDYYISFVTDHPAKLLGSTVPITKAGYNTVSEGSDVLIVKLGNTYRAVCL